MLATIKRDRYVVCPTCEHRLGSVEHLLADLDELNHTRYAGPWYCDQCGAGWTLDVYKTGEINLEPFYDRCIRTLVELQISTATDEPITLFVEGMRFEGPEYDPAEHDGRTRYLYEEHNCPTNWLKDVVEVFLDGERDPHGIADYVRTLCDLKPGEDADEAAKRFVPLGSTLPSPQS